MIVMNDREVLNTNTTRTVGVGGGLLVLHRGFGMFALKSDGKNDFLFMSWCVQSR